MAAFRYTAQTEAGARREGVIAAETQTEAFRRLRADGLRPLQIRAERGPGQGLRLPWNTGPGWKPAALVDLLDDLAALLDGGVSLGAALDMTVDAHAGEPIADLAAVLRRHVQGGARLDEAFNSIGDRDALMVAGVIAAGQASGQFARAVRQAADLIRVRLKARDELVSAAAYPVFLSLFSILLLIFLFVGVLPSFEPILDGANVDPPLLVKVLFGLSHLVRGGGLPFLAAIAGSLLLVRLVGGQGIYRRLWDGWWLDGPLSRLGRPLVFGSAAVFLGMMLSGGVPAADAMRSAAAACPNHRARSRLDDAARRVREGESVASALEGVRGCPRPLSRMAEIGGEIGVMGVLLARGGEVEQTRAVRAIGALTRAAGPVLILVLGGFIGLIMASVFLTIASIGNTALQ